MLHAREILWNVSRWQIILMYAGGLFILFVLIAAFYNMLRIWRSCKEDREDYDSNHLVRKFIHYILMQKTILQDRIAGITHLLISIGGAGLFLITVLLGLEAHTSLRFIKGYFYIFYSLAADILGLVLIAGVGLALWRRLGRPKAKLDSTFQDFSLLILLFAVAMTGYGLEGARIATTEAYHEVYSPIGYFVAKGLAALEPAKGLLLALHQGLWVVHLMIALTLIGLIPFTKLKHIFTAPFNMLLSSLPGRFPPVPVLRNIESREYIGVKSHSDFSFKDALELDACTLCGRCEENCPALLSKSHLSPKKLVNLLQRALRDRSQSARDDGIMPLLQKVPCHELIWTCATCGYCREQCPVFINLLSKIYGLRFYLTGIGRIPPSAAKALESLQYLGNPWEALPEKRGEWLEKFIPRKRTASHPEYIYWVGCSVLNDVRMQEIAVNFIKVLEAAEINYVVIYGQEGCCGDPARRLGEEGLFQRIALANIKKLKELPTDKIITHCPHCAFTLKYEYARLNGRFEVIHHSKLIWSLINQKRLKIPNVLEKRMVYHDPCYLGRYDGGYDEPRRILRSIPDTTLLEMERSRQKALCCGAGGGQMWLETGGGARVNYIRFEEAQRNDPDLIVTACPYCNMMFHEAAKYKGVSESIRIKDLAELFG
jgi:Fe-S oxidoreductase/nitrate reductase gamma subunit